MSAALYGAALVAVAALVVLAVVYAPRHRGRRGRARLRLTQGDHTAVTKALTAAERHHAALGVQLEVLRARIGEPR